jgi:hypothetical protein
MESLGHHRRSHTSLVTIPGLLGIPPHGQSDLLVHTCDDPQMILPRMGGAFFSPLLEPSSSGGSPLPPSFHSVNRTAKCGHNLSAKMNDKRSACMEVIYGHTTVTPGHSHIRRGTEIT